MEHNIDRKEMLDLMLRPAFWVEDGIIRHVNPSATHLLLTAGQAVLPLIPMGSLIAPEDVADTIVFLASERARYVTGQVIKVSGGKAL